MEGERRRLRADASMPLSLHLGTADTMHTPRAALVALLAVALPVQLAAQRTTSRAGRDTSRAPSHETGQVPGTANTPAPDSEHRTVTQHAIVVGGQRVEYDATVGNIVLRDSADQPIATVFYTAYTRRGVRDMSHRPITFAYNGGPGSSSIWLHMGALGPRRVVTPDAQHAAPPPYTIVDNEYTPLDKTDLVFIDPVGTGFSRPLGKAKGKDFWGVDEDVRSLAQFISRYLSENDRWNSPRYLAGESYGTTRSAALVNYLQRRDNMDFNGVILMSAVLDFQTITFDDGNDMPFIMYLPAYAAVAWYHHALPNQPKDLRPFLKEVEHFAMTDYATALLAGADLAPAERTRIINQLHQYTGLSTDYIDKADLRVEAGQFEKELLREHGSVVGRLDARFTGPTGDLLAERAPYDPQSADISSAFVSAFNQYLHGELNFGKGMQYTVSGNVQPWNWNHGQRRGWPGHTNVAVDLSQALQYNTRLHVQLNSGLFDLATPYYAAEWTMAHLQLPKELQSHVHEEEYDAGHMMYLHEPSLAKLKKNIASFIDLTSGAGAGGAHVAEGSH
jgi:carboxypeptidase C (cathepsin A)